jgi:hypothetical protein
VKTNFYTTRLLLLITSLFICGIVKSQISGNVFRDINGDGTRQIANPDEPWEYGFVVRAYNATNVLLATATTNTSGYYSFSAAQTPAGIPVRIEFSVAAGDQPSKRVASNRSNIQFVVAGPGAVNINFAVASKKTFSNNSNPYVATNAYTNGNANSSGSNSAGDNDNLYIFPYDLSNDGGSSRRVKNKHLGAIFGMAWQRQSRTLLMAAYLKRHCSFGANGIGAIYETQISATGIPTTPTLLLDVTSIGINVGTDPRSSTLPSIANTANTDVGVFAEVGKRGIGGMDLSIDGRELYIVNMYEKKLHRINIGNPLKSSFTAADVTGNWLIPDPAVAGTQWRPMAVELYKGKIYVGGVTTKETTTAHNVADTVNLRGIVYEFDPVAATFTEVLRFPLSHRRGFTNADYRYENRNNFWSGWQNNGDVSIGGPLRSGLIGSTNGNNATGIYYPQPMLCNIEFDVDGSMILGIRDRFGDQGGYANLFETGNSPGETYRTLASGEILRAGKSATNWTMENNGSVTTNGVTTTTNRLADNTPLGLGSFILQTLTPWGGNVGPGGGYYYYNQNFTRTGVPAPFNAGATNTSHYVKSNAGILVYPGYNEVLNTAIDPANRGYTNGIIRNYNTGSNAGNMSGRLELIPPSTGNDATNMGKAAALGDLELLLDAEVMEIGNLVWYDANANGRQDAHETGIAGVQVVLRSPGLDNAYKTADDQVWTVATDATGHYYFDETMVNDARRPASWLGVSSTNSGILPGFEYRIEIDPAQTNLQGYILTVADFSTDQIDNDGRYNSGLITYTLNPGGSAAANSIFDNNYNIDFGFYLHYLSLQQLKVNAVLTGSDVNIQWQTTGENNINKYYIQRSLDGAHFTDISSASSKGNGNFNYQGNDNISGINAAAVYYRVQSVDMNGDKKYSAVVAVNPRNTIKLSVGPNPFQSVLNIQFNSSIRTEAVIRLHNAAGQVVYKSKKTMDKGVNSFVLNEFQHMPKGLYVIEVETHDMLSRQKLIKQ